MLFVQEHCIELAVVLASELVIACGSTCCPVHGSDQDKCAAAYDPAVAHSNS